MNVLYAMFTTPLASTRGAQDTAVRQVAIQSPGKYSTPQCPADGIEYIIHHKTIFI